MNTYLHTNTPRTYRRVSASAIANLAATGPQAARLAGVAAETGHNRLWDSSLLDRLSSPISRIRE